MPDRPLDELGGGTVLEAANTPNLNRIARAAAVFGTASHIPDSLPPGSDVGNLSVLGYDPLVYFTGRSPLEAAGMGIPLGKDDLTCRCNLVTVRKSVMEDYSAGHIPTEQAHGIIKTLAAKLETDNLKFFPGVSYRHLIVTDASRDGISTTPPHDISGRNVKEFLPRGKDAGFFLKLMEDAKQVLKDHPVNRDREKNGLVPANSIWLWGEGTAPSLPAIEDSLGVKGAVISAVDLVRGIGRCAAMNVVDVEGATGYLDTNYGGKVEAALKALETCDLVMVHIEAMDETGHEGKTELKTRAVEDFDRRVVGPILEGMRRFGEFMALVTSDHPTPLSTRTHSRDPVPFAVYDSRDEAARNDRVYTEKCAAESGTVFEDGWKLVHEFVRAGRA